MTRTCTRGLILVLLVLRASAVAAQADAPVPAAPSKESSRTIRILEFLGGAGVGLGLHESGHVVTSAIFDADPGIKTIHFGPIPFFAITHAPQSPKREFVISSAGFWMQHASSEWILTARPDLKSQPAPFLKGLLAFDLLNSIGYAGVAFAQAGPEERDTLGMAHATGIDEPWIGAMILVPAVLDGWRYFAPEARWAKWSSRVAKVALVLLVVKSSE
jgi:hypothetical protein